MVAPKGNDSHIKKLLWQGMSVVMTWFEEKQRWKQKTNIASLKRISKLFWPYLFLLTDRHQSIFVLNSSNTQIFAKPFNFDYISHKKINFLRTRRIWISNLNPFKSLWFYFLQNYGFSHFYYIYNLPLNSERKKYVKMDSFCSGFF